MSGTPQIRAEEVVRALAAAAAAVRLYPPTSEIPAQTIARFVQMANAVSRSTKGPVRFVVEPKGFRIGDEVVAVGQTQVTGLAESLYAHQVGQLIIAGGITPEEAQAFLRCVESDVAAVREEGGVRAVIVAAGVSHIAVIELTLRTSTEEGLAGLDLTTAPLEVIGPAVVRAAAEWARTAAAGEGHDEVDEVIGSMESAARDLAAERVAAAMMQLDDQTRSAVLAAAVRQDASGKPMEGALSVISGMKPAMLARLLTLAAARTTGDPHAIMAKLTLPPEALRALELLLRPSPRTEAESGVPASTDPTALVEESLETEEDAESIKESMSSLGEQSQAPRALRTAVRLVERTPDVESVDALGEALARAVAVGAFSLAHGVLEMIAELSEQPGLADAITRARHSLTQGEALTRGLLEVEQSEASDAAAVLNAAGMSGAEAFCDAWLRSNEAQHVTLERVGRNIPEQVIIASARRLRSVDTSDVPELVSMLGRLGDRRAISPLSQALDSHVSEVRAAAISALSKLDTEDSWAAIIATLTHPDQPTALRALAAIRAAGKRGAVPAMLAILQMSSAGTRNHELKREIIEDVRRMKATEGLPVLTRIASRRVVVRSKSRELRDAAKRTVAELQAAQRADGEKVRG